MFDTAQTETVNYSTHFEDIFRETLDKLEATRRRLQEEAIRDSRSIRSTMKLIQENVGTMIYVIAVSKDRRNKSHRIACKNHKLISKTRCYNVVEDCYMVQAYALEQIGSIPVNYRLQIPGCTDSTFDIPLPEKVIMRHLSTKHRIKLEAFKEANRDHSIQYVQFLKTH